MWCHSGVELIDCNDVIDGGEGCRRGEVRRFSVALEHICCRGLKKNHIGKTYDISLVAFQITSGLYS